MEEYKTRLEEKTRLEKTTRLLGKKPLRLEENATSRLEKNTTFWL